MCGLPQSVRSGTAARKAGRLLFKQLSLDVVHEGLKRLNSNSSPGLEGFSAKSFQRFSQVFEPQM